MEMKGHKMVDEMGAAPRIHDHEEENANKAQDIAAKEQEADYFPGELVGHWPSFSQENDLYHCYTLCLNQNFQCDVTSRDVSLIVKCDLGTDFSTTAFQLVTDMGSVTVNMEYTGLIQLSTDQVAMARRFQITILKLLIHKDLSKLKVTLDEFAKEETLPSVAYLLLPCVRRNKNSSPVIDWDCVESASSSVAIWSKGMAGENEIQGCSSHTKKDHSMHTKDIVMCSCRLRNSIVLTPHHTGHIYCITGILENLDGSSTMTRKRGATVTYKEHYQTGHGITLKYEKESLLRGRFLFKVQNWLRRRSGKEKVSRSVVELPPELCEVIVSPIPTSILYSFSLIPSIMYRIESMLLAVRLRKIQIERFTQNVTLPAIKVLEAITTNNCQEEFSLESLETLGDSFLKYAVSQQLFRNNQHDNVQCLTEDREGMISNDALRKLGCNRQLQGFIRDECFDPKGWVIPGDHPSCGGYSWDNEMTLKIKDKNIYNRGSRNMNGEVISDVVEALIGAYLCTIGEVAALFFMEWLGMNIDFVKEELPPCLINMRSSFQLKPEMHKNITHLQSLFKYQFHDPSLLVEALAHKSYQDPDIPRCYKRLEFLGDSVLDYLITVHMYGSFPGMTPGLLTDLRSVSVNNDSYAFATVRAGLHKYILLRASPELQNIITRFIDSFEQSYSGSIFGWQAKTARPKVLADIIESIAGAILIDSGFNKDTVWESIRPLLEPMVTPETVECQPKRELSELCDKKKYKVKFIPTFDDGFASVTAEVKNAHGVVYRVTCTDSNKRTAERLAAKAMLASLKANISGL